MGKPIIHLLTAIGGTGKSAYTCRKIVDEWMAIPGLRFVHNMPLDVPEICKAFVAGSPGADWQDHVGRFEKLPDSVWDAWCRDFKQGGETPEQTFDGVDLTNTALILDEVHYVWSKFSSKDHKQQWSYFCSQVRARGLRIVWLISQNEEKLAEEAKAEAGYRISLVATDQEIEPFTGMRYEHIWQLIAKCWTGSYDALVQVIEYVREGRAWVEQSAGEFTLSRRLFKLYNPYKNMGTGVDSTEIEKREWEFYSTPFFFLWLYVSNIFPLTLRGLGLCFFVWFFWFGGFDSVFGLNGQKGLLSPISAAQKKEQPLPGPPGLPKDIPRAPEAPKELPRAPKEEFGKPPEPKSEPPPEVSGFFDGKLLMRDGRILGVGDLIKEGGTENEAIKSIDSKNRSYVVGARTHRLPSGFRRSKRNDP